VKRVLIVEDDAYKLEALSDLISQIFGTLEIFACRSVQSAVASLSSQTFDVVVLDMSLPSHDLEKGSMLGIPRLSGGIEVLFELDYIGSAAHIMIVTQYPEIEMSGKLVPLNKVVEFIGQEYGLQVIACVYYDSDSTEWKAEISRNMKEALKS
jgi:CheY-like chemotaxis protein